LIAPFAKTFKHELGLDYTETLLLTAIPVVLGSLLRVPLGILTDRYGGRIVFSLLLAFSALPAIRSSPAGTGVSGRASPT
jgi:NNP family nitrate/nitrite transporter-like MFS transporter